MLLSPFFQDAFDVNNIEKQNKIKCVVFERFIKF